jgi:hypothetical protein
MISSRDGQGGFMGLAEDLKALQELREKGEMSESAYAAARDAAIRKHGTPSGGSKPSFFTVGRVILLLILVFFVWYFLRLNIGNKQASDAIRTAVRAPITLNNSVENIPASSWKAVGLNLPYPGTVDVSLEVVRGNPVDVFLTTTDQIETMKKEQWNNVRVYPDFNAVKTKTYRRTGQLGQGSYYLVMRDTSLGILSASASDISVKVQLNP